MSRGRFLLSRDAVPFTAPQFDLLSAATQLDTADGHWRMGVTWEPLCPESDATVDPCTAVTDDGGTAVPFQDPPEKTATTEWQIRGAVPFTAYAEIDCSPVGVWDDLPSRAQQALTRSEVYAVERAFWTGTAGSVGTETVYPHLAADTEVTDGGDLLQPAVDQVSTTAAEPHSALAELEAALRDCYPGVGTIHVPIEMYGLMMESNLLESRSGQMFTRLGNRVVLGGGYTGSAPDGTSTPGEYWVYATGQVFYQRDQIRRFDIVESFDRDVNTVKVITERTYVVGWDCCLLGIPMLNVRV